MGTLLVGNSTVLPPKASEIEVSVFGPGYGECVLLHVGEGNWLVVDSCIDPESKAPIALKYLHQIGVDPAKAVKQIIATHWHDDHVRGLADIVRQCESAEFVCSEALKATEFRILAAAFGISSIMDQQKSGVQEFYSILKIFEERCKRTDRKYIPPIFASANKVLWRYDLYQHFSCDEAKGRSCVVYALSPSDTSSILAKLEIADLIPAQKTTKKRIPPISINNVSVALWVDFGDSFILLGSDLEEAGDERIGWSAILASKARPIGKACFYKVPHHGSITAHHPDVWNEMLVDKPIGVLTPFVLGSVRLPTGTDTDRIKTFVSEAYITAVPQKKFKRGRDRTTEKLIKETVRFIRPYFLSGGHVRLRAELPHTPTFQRLKWNVELFNGAEKL